MTDIDTLNSQAWELRSRDSEQAVELARRAMALAEESGYRRGIIRAGITLASVEVIRSNYDAARPGIEGALERARAIEDHEGEAMGEAVLGTIHRATGAPEEALAHFTKSLELSRRIGNREVESASLGGIGNIHRIRGEYDRALEYHLQGLEIAASSGIPEAEGHALLGTAATYERLGNYDAALDYYRRCADIARSIPHPRLQAYVTGNLAVIHHDLGDLSTALTHELDCLRCKDELNDPRGISISLNNIGIFYRDLGAYDSALEALMRSLEICEQLGDREGESVALNNIGLTYDSLNQSFQALDCYIRSLRISQELGHTPGEAFSYYHLGKFHADRGSHSKGLLYYLKCLGMHRRSGDRQAERAALQAIGSVYRALGDAGEARHFLEQSRALAVELGDTMGESTALTYLGGIELREGDYAAATGYLERGLAIARETGFLNLCREALLELIEIFRRTGEEERRRECEAQYAHYTEQIFNEDSTRRVRDLTERFQGNTVRREGKLLGLEEEDLARLQAAVKMEHRAIAAAGEVAPATDGEDIRTGQPATAGTNTRGGKTEEGIRVMTFGALRVIANGHELRKGDWSRKRARDLFKLLLLNHRAPVTIDEIHDKLWGERGDRNIELLVMNAASHIRKALESGGAGNGHRFRLDCSDGAYMLDLGDDSRIDFIRFKELILAARRSSGTEERGRLYAEAIALYQGDFLQEDLFVEWTEFQRRILKDAFLEGMEYLAREDLRTGRMEDAIDRARLILLHDDLSETAYRILLQGLRDCGRHGEALRAFEQCRAMFARELGREPPEEIRKMIG